MDAADSSANSSKVIVQCHDPSNLFEQLIPRLDLRLPLTKLHWKSPNRPLRSIDQLNVSFVRDDSKRDSTTAARRHQIPGLRQTPFVKIFILRCDDKDVYKETARKDIKQWLKSQGISQDGKPLTKGQERHDAYEHIILHVVLPDTPAAAQPKSSKHISTEATDSTDSVNSKSKWTGKSTSTIFDKLRADFSSSSKVPFERVAQVRLINPDNKQPNALAPLDIEEQWKDLIEKLKSAILLSFDARVTQYEDDIRDRDSQRHLPGWNFCTFFVLKEGLARGFESVGLVEDASAVYGELDAGLDTIVREQASRGEPDPTSALLSFSADLKPAIRFVLDNIDNHPQPIDLDVSDIDLQRLIDLEKDDFPLDNEKRQYQQRILTNQVSALDFRIYIFTRQLQLLFRQATIAAAVTKARTSVASVPKTQYDRSALAGICEQATSFIAFASRALRRDLYAAWGGQEGLSEEELQAQHIVIGGIVASWKWSAVMQIIADCQIVTYLGDALSNALHSVHSTSSLSALPNGQTNTQNQMFSLWAGELLLMARDTIKDILASEVEGLSGEGNTSIAIARGVRSKSLRHILQTTQITSYTLQLITAYAYRCFVISGRTSVAHLMLHDLAVHEMENDDVEEATWWLEQVPELSTLQARTATDRALLHLYAKCLKSQDRSAELAKTLVTILLCSVSSPIARSLPQYNHDSQEQLDELVNISTKVPETHLPLAGFMSITNVARSISHGNSSDGFNLSLSLSLRFQATIEISNIGMVLVASGSQEPTEIVLSSKGSATIGPSAVQVNFKSNIISEGWYSPKQMTFRVGNLIFHHEFQPIDAEEADLSFSLPKPHPIMVYPHQKSLSVTGKQSHILDLTQPGTLSFEISATDEVVSECILRFRPASAGFRLDILAAKLRESSDWESFEIVRQDDMNAVRLSNSSGSGRATIEIPFSTEHQSTVASVRIEARYRVSEETFIAFYKRSMSISLPISINVQDIFQVDKVFSRFTATPSTSIPLKLLRWEITKTDSFQIRNDNISSDHMDVFPKMSASWIVEVSRQSQGSQNTNKLPLTVRYQTYDELIIHNVEHQFRQDLKTSPFNTISELLTPHLLSQIPAMWTDQDLEMSVLLQEFEMFNFDKMSWQDTLRALEADLRGEVESWLRSWHSQHQHIALTQAEIPVREVRLSVEVPNPSVVISTNLGLAIPGQQRFAVGEVVVAEITINCAHSMDSNLEIMFDVASPPDAWLIGGRKRGTLTAPERQSTIGIILIPQRPGHLLLPSIDVRCRQIDGVGGARDIAFEVEHRSRAKSVLIIHGLQSSTIAMDTEGMPSRHWVLDSQRRRPMD